MTTSTNSGPLEGYKVIELAGIGPGPYCGQLLADMGADVIRVDRSGGGMKSIDGRGKSSIVLDLRQPEGVEVLLKLVESADALIEGFRPGVTERLGVGPEVCHARNPKLVYGRMTGWGQEGPWSKMAGHDINYLSITGALNAMGTKGQPPFPPLNFVGDYGGGSQFLAIGVLGALLKAQKTGKGEVVDTAIVDGVSSMMGIVYSLHASGLWRTERQGNLLDGAMPYYRCYATSDDKYMAVGPIEPQFFAIMLELLEIDPEDFGAQNNPKLWAGQHAKLEAIFASKTRDEWAVVFDNKDACVTPVLDYIEATKHPHNAARNSHTESGGFIQPHSVPRFESAGVQSAIVANNGEGTDVVLQSLGYSAEDIAKLREAKTVT